MSNDDIELSIRWSAETEDLGNEVWCSKAAADAILRLAKQKERLESRIAKLEAVVKSAKNLGPLSGRESWEEFDQAIRELERE